jgi:hypothetical protein
VSEAVDFYRDKLDLKGAQRKGAREAALARAHEIRQFEIELYWKRANYFWLLQAAVFAAVGLTWKAEGATFPKFVPLILSSVGLLTAWAGWLGTQGSKFWQRNWEHHIDMLETEFEGNLYKSVYVGPSGVKWSLSGISENLAFCFAIFWSLVLATVSIWANPNWTFAPSQISRPNVTEWLTFLSWAIAIGGCIFLYSRGSGVKGQQNPYPDVAKAEGLSPAKARLTKDSAAKPYLLRRKPHL